MNEKLLELLGLIEILDNAGVLQETLKAFAEEDYNIITIEDLVDAINTEISYWEYEEV